jgi:hypothetical protein
MGEWQGNERNAAWNQVAMRTYRGFPVRSRGIIQLLVGRARDSVDHGTTPPIKRRVSGAIKTRYPQWPGIWLFCPCPRRDSQNMGWIQLLQRTRTASEASLAINPPLVKRLLLWTARNNSRYRNRNSYLNDRSLSLEFEARKIHRRLWHVERTAFVHRVGTIHNCRRSVW